jgi:hypothetical protein
MRPVKKNKSPIGGLLLRFGSIAATALPTEARIVTAPSPVFTPIDDRGELKYLAPKVAVQDIEGNISEKLAPIRKATGFVT